MRSRFTGFTLVELAVVLAIIATLLGTLLVPLSTRVELNNIRATDRAMEEIREALLGHAMANGRLPCPDTDGNGFENGGRTLLCTERVGFLPGASLGVSSVDAWGRLFRYQVALQFARDGFNLGARGDITIYTRGDNRNTPTVEVGIPNVIANNLPVVVLSHGPNGFGGTLSNGTAVPLPDNFSSRDESTNASAGTAVGKDNYMARYPSAGRNDCYEGLIFLEAKILCEFDDRLVWLSRNVIFNRMVTAGVLP